MLGQIHKLVGDNAINKAGRPCQLLASFFFKNGQTRDSFSCIFVFSSTLHTVRDSNLQPLEYKSPPITTRPGLLSSGLFLYMCQYRWKEQFYNKVWPDVRMKSSTIFPKQSNVFQKLFKKSPNFWAIFVKNGSQKLSKIAQSGHTDFRSHSHT